MMRTRRGRWAYVRLGAAWDRGVSDLLISCFRNQVPLQRGDSANKERGGRHLPANHKLRGPELATASAASDTAAESDQQQARDTL